MQPQMRVATRLGHCPVAATEGTTGRLPARLGGSFQVWSLFQSSPKSVFSNEHIPSSGAQVKKKQQEMQEQELNQEEARQLLQIMEQEEQKVQQKLRKAKTKKSKSDKDW